MADEKNMDGRGNRRRKLYDSEASQKHRKDKEPEKKPESGTTKGDSGAELIGSITGSHAEERKTLFRQHEAERRDQHGNHRDEHRALHQRQEAEHAKAKPEDVRHLHRKHEAEHAELNHRHHSEHTRLRNRQHEEMQKMHERHEAALEGDLRHDNGGNVDVAATDANMGGGEQSAEPTGRAKREQAEMEARA